VLVALDRNPEPEPDLVHATRCKQPSLIIVFRVYLKSAEEVWDLVAHIKTRKTSLSSYIQRLLIF
jgi:hypothetical protein